MFSGNRVEVLNHPPDRLAAQLGKNVPFVRKMLVNHGMRKPISLAIARSVTAS
jgi:hypothetical protein